MTSPNPASCTQPTPQWIKARRSDNAYACVEVMNVGTHRYVRDSKHAPAGPVPQIAGRRMSASGWHRGPEPVCSEF